MNKPLLEHTRMMINCYNEAHKGKVMNKPKYIQELFAGLNTNLNKSELGVYILGQSTLPVGCTAWSRVERGDYYQSTNAYFDLLIMVLEAANLGEPWAKQLIADFLVRVRT